MLDNYLDLLNTTKSIARIVRDSLSHAFAPLPQLQYGLQARAQQEGCEPVLHKG